MQNTAPSKEIRFTASEHQKNKMSTRTTKAAALYLDVYTRRITMIL